MHRLRIQYIHFYHSTKIYSQLASYRLLQHSCKDISIVAILQYQDRSCSFKFIAIASYHAVYVAALSLLQWYGVILKLKTGCSQLYIASSDYKYIECTSYIQRSHLTMNVLCCAAITLRIPAVDAKNLQLASYMLQTELFNSPYN